MALPCRIACVRIGQFAIGALHSAPTGGPSARREDSATVGADPGGSDARADQALVAVAERNGKPRVVATGAAARARGVAVGMALTEAKALAADLIAMPWDEERIARAALETVTTLLAASPRVSWAGMSPRTAASARPHTDVGVWWIDAAGLGDEAKLARRLVAIARGLAYGPARAGIADSAVAAYAAARGRTHARFRIAPPGTDAEFLAPFPLALLDLDDDLAATLRSLGLTTLGQLAALDADEIEARFGPEALAAHRLARGLDARGPTTPRDAALPTVEVELGGPVATAEPLLFVLRGALASLGEALRTRGLAAREIRLALQLDDGSTAERAIRPARPTSHADALFDHCRSALEAWPLPEPATGLVLSAAVTVPATGEQGSLLAPRWADPAALAAAFDRIRGSEGTDAVAVPQTRDAHLPEDGGSWTHGRTDARTHGNAKPSAAGLQTALRLLDAPIPVHVRLGREGLAAFRHDDGWHDVTGWSGPERLAPRWWERDAGGPAGRPAAPRDYFTARTADGTLWLLRRSAASRQWVVEGWWD